eukprot:scaffold7583_cov118-Isochrysis_galbana.AAC.6
MAARVGGRQGGLGAGEGLPQWLPQHRQPANHLQGGGSIWDGECQPVNPRRPSITTAYEFRVYARLRRARASGVERANGIAPHLASPARLSLLPSAFGRRFFCPRESLKA